MRRLLASTIGAVALATATSAAAQAPPPLPPPGPVETDARTVRAWGEDLTDPFWRADVSFALTDGVFDPPKALKDRCPKGEKVKVEIRWDTTIPGAPERYRGESIGCVPNGVGWLTFRRSDSVAPGTNPLESGWIGRVAPAGKAGGKGGANRPVRAGLGATEAKHSYAALYPTGHRYWSMRVADPAAGLGANLAEFTTGKGQNGALGYVLFPEAPPTGAYPALGSTVTYHVRWDGGTRLEGRGSPDADVKLATLFLSEDTVQLTGFFWGLIWTPDNRRSAPVGFANYFTTEAPPRRYNFQLRGPFRMRLVDVTVRGVAGMDGLPPGDYYVNWLPNAQAKFAPPKSPLIGFYQRLEATSIMPSADVLALRADATCARPAAVPATWKAFKGCTAWFAPDGQARFNQPRLKWEYVEEPWAGKVEAFISNPANVSVTPISVGFVGTTTYDFGPDFQPMREATRFTEAGEVYFGPMRNRVPDGSGQCKENGQWAACQFQNGVRVVTGSVNANAPPPCPPGIVCEIAN